LEAVFSLPHHGKGQVRNACSAYVTGIFSLKSGRKVREEGAKDCGRQNGGEFQSGVVLVGLPIWEESRKKVRAGLKLESGPES
jgi:hypothetical protein